MKQLLVILALLCALPVVQSRADSKNCCSGGANEPQELAFEKNTDFVDGEPAIRSAPLITLSGTFFEDSHYSASVEWNWDVCGKIKPVLTYLYLDEQYRGLKSSPSADYRTWKPVQPPEPPTPYFGSRAVWGIGFTIDLGKKRRR